jgi:hypothetical protein
MLPDDDVETVRLRAAGLTVTVAVPRYTSRTRSHRNRPRHQQLPVHQLSTVQPSAVCVTSTTAKMRHSTKCS